MLGLLFISFYTSRVVLDKLGVTDYGIYNVVGGLAAMCAFFSSSLSNATERYLNMALGKKDFRLANEVFNQNLLVFILIALGVIVVAETVVRWTVFDSLVIPADKWHAAGWVYQFTILSLAVNLVGIVFLAAIIANERMKIFSIIGIVDGVIKLIIAFLIDVLPFEHLVSFAFMSFLEVCIVQGIYAIYCFRNFAECRVRLFWDRGLLRETFGFIGWNVFGTGIYMAKDTGVNILMNLFYGPVVNAARAVAVQVSNAVSNFTANIFTAVRPQMVKAYSAGEFDELESLFFKSSKFTILLFWVLCLPVMIAVDDLLSIWLADVPAWSGPFTVWVLADSMLAVLTHPTWSIALASGKLKKYTLFGNGMLLLAFPLCWIVFNAGASPVSAFIVIFAARLLQVISVVRITGTLLQFTPGLYLRRIALPVIGVIVVTGLLSLIFASWSRPMIESKLLFVIATGIFTVLLNLAVISAIALTSDERHTIREFIRSKLGRKKS